MISKKGINLVMLVIIMITIVVSIIITVPKSIEIRECKEQGNKLVFNRISGMKECMTMDEYVIMKKGNEYDFI